jgi:hypothetical protein
VISAGKMMNKANGPVRHKKQKDKGFVPKKRVPWTKKQLGTNPMPMTGSMAMAALAFHRTRSHF